MELRDIMTTDVETIRPDATIEEAARKLNDLDVGSLPVCDGDRVLGMITDRDITVRATAAGDTPSGTSVRDVMTPDAVYVYIDQSIEEAAQIMAQHQIRRLIVLNHDKRLLGIVSLGDVAVATGKDQLSGDTLEDISKPSLPDR